MTPAQLKEFTINSKRLLAKCTKPDRKGARPAAPACAAPALLGANTLYTSSWRAPVC